MTIVHEQPAVKRRLRRVYNVFRGMTVRDTLSELGAIVVHEFARSGTDRAAVLATFDSFAATLRREIEERLK